MTIQIVSLNVGKPQMLPYKSEELLTGIVKNKVETEVLQLTPLGFIGDGQADLVYHGGPDKAICVYSYEHYPYWERELQLPLVEGAFGENLTVRGLTEDQVCIGDIYSIGDVQLQVTQPRQPCHKLAKRHNRPDLVLLVQTTGYTGFYFRVLVPGTFNRTLPLTLLARHPEAPTIAYANRIYYHDKHNAAGMRKLLEVQALSESWRSALTRRLSQE
ncbi:MAG: hypothetical protein K0R67_883 [Paenibacillus sp.]|jgi:MOSC domain-containing protein YiiM|nr:hypothetical protein [Paenibacillus sp.]